MVNTIAIDSKNFGQVSNVMLKLQRENKIRIDEFNWSLGHEGVRAKISFYCYGTKESVTRVMTGKLIEGVSEQVLYLLEQVK